MPGVNSIITHSDPKSPIAEAYRVLRTNIQFSSVDTPLKVMVVTSAGPGEGKSTTITNLAVAFAQSGSRTVLIDADLRKPKIHKIFSIDKSRAGLSNILSQKVSLDEVAIKTEVENLDIITCGAIPPNPSELLSSKAMKQFLQDIKEKYDIIFIDAPPVGTVTDAAIISTIVDGTILVAASGTVIIDALKRAKDLLEKVNANIIGVVLNKLDRNASGNSYYYYYNYNYYYGEKEGEKIPKKRKRRRMKKEEV